MTDLIEKDVDSIDSFSLFNSSTIDKSIDNSSNLTDLIDTTYDTNDTTNMTDSIEQININNMTNDTTDAIPNTTDTNTSTQPIELYNTTHTLESTDKQTDSNEPTDNPTEQTNPDITLPIRSPDKVYHSKFKPHKLPFLTFTSKQLGIIFDILKYLKIYYPIVLPLFDSRTESLTSSTPQQLITAYNLSAHELNYAYTCAHYPATANNFLYNPLLLLFTHLDDNSRNIYSTNTIRGIIRGNLYSNPNTQPETLTELSKAVSLLSSVRFSQYINPSSFNGVAALNKLCNYFATLAPLSRQVSCCKYTHPLSYHTHHKRNIKLPSYNTKSKYRIVLIPRDLEKKFNRIGKYFEEVKTLLKYNPDNGFYSYTIDNVQVPIICKHEYLSLEGVSPSEISIECYMDGVCKYCGQELNAYHEQINDNLPPKVYDLIFKYIKSINANVEADSLTFILFNMIYKLVDNNVKKINIKNYDASVVALAALFLYKVFVSTKGNIEYNHHKDKFLSNVFEYCGSIGWDKSKVEQLVKEDSLFAGIDNINSIIKGKIYVNDISFINALPISIMFEKLVHPKDFDKLKPTNKIEELFIMSKDGVLHSGIIEYNKLIDKSNMLIWKNKMLNDTIKDVENVVCDLELKKLNVRVSKNGAKFFDKICKWYCPVNGMHDYSNKICKHCGLKEDLSNKHHVYFKYESVINNNYTSKPNVIDESRFMIGKAHTFDDIKKYSASDLFSKFININNNSLKVALENGIKNDNDFRDAVKLISVLTTFDADKIERNTESIMRWYCYIIDKGIKDRDEMINELKYLYLKIRNIGLLLV